MSSGDPDKKLGILLTGGTGFLGSNLLGRLWRDGHQLFLLKRSWSNLSRIVSLVPHIQTFDVDIVPIEKIFESHSIDLVIHCATNYGRRPVPPTEIIEANLVLPLRLLQLAQTHGVRCFINTDTILDKRINHYTLSKHQFLEWFGVLSDKLVCVNVSLSHFYGPLDDPSKFVSHVVSALRNRVERLSLTPGEQKRDFIYIEDVVSALVAVVDFAHAQEPSLYQFQVGCNRQVSIRDFVSLARDISGNSETILDFGALPYRQNEVMEVNVDTSKLRQLGWRPKITLEEGIQRTFEMEASQQGR